ncbi:MAG: hypothetical protein JW709_06080 [Sedimentisphaerales bacterium]|nr:hypothetical protein [Sedimentisphaerales bacterium]
MKRDEIIFELAGVTHIFRCPTRDFHILYELEQARPFLSNIGLLENMSVTRPIPTGIIVQRSRQIVCMTAEAALNYVKRDEDLLTFNYSVTYDQKAPGEGPVLINGYTCMVETRPPGYCTLRLIQPGANGIGRFIETRDLRIHKQVQTDTHGLMRIQRHKAPLTLPDEFDRLINFLKQNQVKEVAVHIS